MTVFVFKNKCVNEFLYLTEPQRPFIESDLRPVLPVSCFVFSLTHINSAAFICTPVMRVNGSLKAGC